MLSTRLKDQVMMLGKEEGENEEVAAGNRPSYLVFRSSNTCSTFSTFILLEERTKLLDML